MLKYRPEIDGLRALAVLAVLAYHLDDSGTASALLPGGFLGVDVFFVISGFLITSVILADARAEGGFSFARFYERRARRLLPALLLVLLATLPFAWLLLLPEQLVQFAKSLLATLGFASNFFWLASQQAYGAQNAAMLPLLHTWSLGVEEQFYLLFPLLLLFVRRHWPAWVSALLLAVALLSLAGSEALAARHPDAAFYLLPSRMWELGLGAWLACRGERAPIAGLRRLLPLLGLALILASMLLPGLHASYPGLKALLPVCGTLLVIRWAGADPVTRLLASRPVVAVGLVSYSLYLWHYPIYAFGRHLQPAPDVVDKLAWVVLSLVLATLSWKVVEGPCRDRRRLPLRGFVAIVLVAALSLVVASAAWIANRGVGGRLGYLGTLLQSTEHVWTEQNGQYCHSGGGGRNPAFPLRESCVFDNSRHAASDRSLLLVGDSHAGALSDDMQRLAAANGMNFVQVTQAGCAHVPGYGDAMCMERAAQLRDYVASTTHATVVYNARIPLFLEQSPFDNGEGGNEGVYPTAPAAEREAQFPARAAALRQQLEAVARASDRLVIVYPVPEQGFNILQRLLSRGWRITEAADLPTVTTSYAVFQARVRRSYAVLDSVVGDNVVRVYPEQFFCRPATGRCVVSEGERIYFEGDNHVSSLGASLLGAEIGKKLRFAPAKPARGP